MHNQSGDLVAEMQMAALTSTMEKDFGKIVDIQWPDMTNRGTVLNVAKLYVTIIGTLTLTQAIVSASWMNSKGEFCA